MADFERGERPPRSELVCFSPDGAIRVERWGSQFRFISLDPNQKIVDFESASSLHQPGVYVINLHFSDGVCQRYFFNPENQHFAPLQTGSVSSRRRTEPEIPSAIAKTRSGIGCLVVGGVLLVTLFPPFFLSRSSQQHSDPLSVPGESAPPPSLYPEILFQETFFSFDWSLLDFHSDGSLTAASQQAILSRLSLFFHCSRDGFGVHHLKDGLYIFRKTVDGRFSDPVFSFSFSVKKAEAVFYLEDMVVDSANFEDLGNGLEKVSTSASPGRSY